MPADQSVGGGISSASIAEAATTADAIASTSGIPASASEAATAADSSAGIPEAGAVAVTEAVTAGDTINLIAAFGVSIDEAVIAAESSVSGGTTTGDRMPYTTRVQLDNTFGASEVASLLDRDNDGGEDVGVLAYAIANADALIDGYLSSRYEVPLLEIPQLIAQISADIVRFLLWEDKAPAEVQKRYDERIKQLQQIQQGYISLPSNVPASTTAAGGVGYVETEPLFTMDSLSEF
jgi:phage gp36-like protein